MIQLIILIIKLVAILSVILVTFPIWILLFAYDLGGGELNLTDKYFSVLFSIVKPKKSQ